MRTPTIQLSAFTLLALAMCGGVSSEVLDSQHEDPCIITSTISSYSPVFVTTTRTITVIATDVASGASDANQARLQALA
ncbi:hypothetical protein L226DRAFT_537378 [Lentinus tigrinus ALCF2SS1-7]|uniref:uncharacterized protein n=1 Tax=Lentinus tigrinus ALCF2SS1-7 TaxID=1328758 RepID=UPI001165D404|nr:hypothetical protein L226DRAFT_537378 [Lentinus tigrinus ALCF2SS1-7]